MGPETLVASLLRVAREDLRGAQLLATQANRNAIYLAEQAAEKIIRAVLTSEGLHAGIKHQLDEMVDLVPDANPFKADLRSLEDLSAFATSYRYPTPTGRIPNAPGIAEVAARVTQIDAVLGKIATRWGLNLDQAGPPPGPLKPLR